MARCLPSPLPLPTPCSVRHRPDRLSSAQATKRPLPTSAAGRRGAGAATTRTRRPRMRSTKGQRASSGACSRAGLHRRHCSRPHSGLAPQHALTAETRQARLIAVSSQDGIRTMLSMRRVTSSASSVKNGPQTLRLSQRRHQRTLARSIQSRRAPRQYSSARLEFRRCCMTVEWLVLGLSTLNAPSQGSAGDFQLRTQGLAGQLACMKVRDH